MMVLKKEKKQEIINDLTDKFSRQKIVIFVDYTGLKVGQLENLREKLREKGIDCQVAKKTLIDLALDKAKLKNIAVRSLPGQIGVVIGYQDEVTASKILYDFSKENKEIKILSGLVGGEVNDSGMIVALAKLPSKEELMAQFVALVSYPLSGLVNVWEGGINNLVNVLEAVKGSKEV